MKISNLKPLLFLLVFALLATQGFSQDPGDNPDGPPPAVPIEDYLHFIVLGAGAILSLIVIKRLEKKTAK
jgi:hypothetical protein